MNLTFQVFLALVKSPIHSQELLSEYGDDRGPIGPVPSLNAFVGESITYSVALSLKPRVRNLLMDRDFPFHPIMASTTFSFALAITKRPARSFPREHKHGSIENSGGERRSDLVHWKHSIETKIHVQSRLEHHVLGLIIHQRMPELRIAGRAGTSFGTVRIQHVWW